MSSPNEAYEAQLRADEDLGWLSALTNRYVTGLVVLALISAVVAMLRRR